jgi:plastocyanin
MKRTIPFPHPRRTWRVALAGVTTLALLAIPAALLAAGSSRPLQVEGQIAKVAATPQVHIDNFQFSPATLTVAKGTTVTWINQDDMVHTVTSAAKVFSSAGLETDDTFSFTFTTPGAYTYFCKLHPRMTGTVIVQ